MSIKLLIAQFNRVTVLFCSFFGQLCLLFVCNDNKLATSTLVGEHDSSQLALLYSSVAIFCQLKRRRSNVVITFHQYIIKKLVI